MPKNNSNTHRISTAIGTGILCAALAITPIATNVLTLNNVTHAAGLLTRCTEIMPESWQNVQISKDNYIDAINSAEKIAGVKGYNAIFVAERKASEAEADILDTLKEEVQAAGFDDDLYGANLIERVKQSPNYNDNLALQAAVKKAESALNTVVNEFKASVAASDSSIDLNGFSDLDDIYELIEKPLGERYGDKYPYYVNLGFLSNQVNDSDYMNDAELRKDDFYELVCSAKTLDPSFKVSYVLSVDPFASSTGSNAGNSNNKDDSTSNTNTPSTSDKPVNGTIENKDNGVKVSGININVSYTLNVNLVPSTDLKLTGDSFKNSINQAFYDIFIRDSKNNVISNTGKVEVSIKLPSNMSAKSDFVVYYVPTAANGEYLTDKAQAIKGVKVSTDGWLTFETDHFSVYGIVEYPKHTAPNTGVVAQHEGSAVVTGVKIAAGIVSVLTAAGAAVVVRRQILRKEGKQA